MSRNQTVAVPLGERQWSVRLADYDNQIHFLDSAKGQLSCGRGIPGAHSTLRAEFVTCGACRGHLDAD